MGSPPPPPPAEVDEGAGKAAAAEAPSEAPAPAAAKPRKVRGNLRKRDAASDDDGAATPGAAAAPPNNKRPAVAGKHDLAFSSAATAATAPAVGVAYASSSHAPTGRDTLATAELATETEFDRDARAVKEKALAAAREAAERAGAGAGGAAGPSSTSGPEVYRGAAAYNDFKAGFRREGASLTGADNKATGAHGPLRASLYVRTTARFDYQPDVCKDYKETGYCAYGDACKFLHDRGDHKSGWEVERDWEKAQREKRDRQLERRAARLAAGGGGGGGDDEEDEDEEEEAAAGEGKGKGKGAAAGPPGLPFACLACRVPWLECGSAPVATRCRHYFCERCALQRQSQGVTACAACGQPTQGIFNAAPEVLRAAKRAKAKRDEQEEAARR